MRRPTVLVVEDDDDLRALVVLLLSGEGYRAETARHGEEGLERVHARRPDLVLLDMRMPVMGGAEFAARLHEEYGHAVPIVVMTAADSAALRAREIGAEGWIAKPFSPDQLIQAVRARLGTGAAGGSGT